MEYNYLLSLSVILLATKGFSLISRRVHLPQVVGALVAGLLFGPAVLGALTMKLLGAPLCLMPSPFLSKLAELGVIVIMFSAGMGTNVKDLRDAGTAGFIVALIGVLVPMGMGTALFYFFEPAPSLVSALFPGAVLTATSVSITVATLKELGKLTTKVGNTILAAALIDDLLGLICLTLVTGLAGGDVHVGIITAKILAFFVFVGLMGAAYHSFMTWLDRREGERNLHRYPILGFALCLFMAWASERFFGVADITGAFAAGMIIAASPKGQYIASKFDTISYLLLTPVFFANIGLEVTLPEMSASMAAFTVALVAVSVLSKLIGCGLGAKCCGFTGRQSYQIGVGMICRGEVALIVASKGVAMNMIPAQYIGPIVIMIIFCSIATPILLKSAFRGTDDAAEDLAPSSQLERADQVDTITSDLLLRENRHRIPMLHWRERHKG